MNFISDRPIGFVLILGFVMLVAGAIVAPSGAYSGAIEDRLAVIGANEGQWLLSKVFDGLAVALASAGMVMVGMLNARRDGGWMNTVGAVSMGLAGVAGLFWVYLLVDDPGPLYDRGSPAPIVVLFVGLLALGLLSFGLHFLSSAFARWLGWVLTVVGGAVLVALILIQLLDGGPESAFGLGSLMYVAVLALGITLARSREAKSR